MLESPEKEEQKEPSIQERSEYIANTILVIGESIKELENKLSDILKPHRMVEDTEEMIENKSLPMSSLGEQLKEHNIRLQNIKLSLISISDRLDLNN